MWRGIEVADQGSMVPTHLTIMNGTTISGAEYAVNIIGNANVDIQNSLFDNNYLSVYFPEYAPGHTGAFTFENTTISQTIGTVLPSSYPTQTTALGTKPLAGFEIHDASSMQIGTAGSAASFNTFSNLNAGIFSFNSNMNVSNTKFLNLVEDAVYSPTSFFNGSGVYADGSGGFYSLNVYGFGQNSGITNFEGCKYGVFANIMSVSLKDNVMDTYNGPGAPVKMYTGCRASFCDSRDISIAYNNMNCERNGVLLYYNNRTNTCEVLWNNIQFGSTSGISSGVGIACFQFGGHENYTLISHNRIDYNQYGSDGIQIYTSGNMRIEYNEMYMTDNNFNLSGIRVSYSHGIDISCNSVHGATNPYTNIDQGAIKILKSSCIVGCNYVNNTYDGIYFSQPCTPTNLFGNAIYNHQVGLHLDAQAIIGTQLYQGNLWLGTYLQFGALNSNLLGSYYNAGEYFEVNNNNFFPDQSMPCLLQYHLRV